MIYIETLERESNQKYDDFRDMVQERINLVTMYNPKNLLNISWISEILMTMRKNIFLQKISMIF